MRQGVPLDHAWPRFRILLVDLLEKEYQHSVDASDRMHFLGGLLRPREQLTGADDASDFWREASTTPTSTWPTSRKPSP